MTNDLLLLDSITDADEKARGGVVLSGSHGGLYPAALASRAGLRAVMFHDAGIGFERAGVAGVLALAGVGMAAVGFNGCRIGSASDALEKGTISVANDVAGGLGIEAGMTVTEAGRRLAEAPVPPGVLPPVEESRRCARLEPNGPEVWLLDSASLVRPEDAGAIVITGSHGGIIGGDPKRALKARARIAVFNDAGVGAEGEAESRLPVLDGWGVAAVLVAHDSARIGDAGSALETGVISRINERARDLGAAAGVGLEAWLREIA